MVRKPKIVSRRPATPKPAESPDTSPPSAPDPAPDTAVSETTESANGETIQVADGETTESADGETIEVTDSETAEVAANETIEISDGETTESADGETIEVTDSETAEVAANETIEVSDGETAEVAEAAAGDAADRSSIRDREAVRVFALAADYHRRGLLSDAVRAYSRALNLDPINSDIYNNLGVALRAQGKLAAAVACYRRALVLRPDHAGTYANLGNALRDQGNLRSAVTAMSQAIRLAPRSPDVIHNLGLAMRDAGNIDVAISCFNSVIEIQEDHAAAHVDLGLTLLAQQEYQRGFEEIAWRRRMPSFRRDDIEIPEWDGSELGGKTVLVLGEGSSGDILQFARYIPLIKQRGGNVVIECHSSLARVVSGVHGADRVVMSGGRAPAADVFAPIMSLPGILGKTDGVDDGMVPYIAPPEVISVQLPQAQRNQLRVGLAWAPGNPNGENDPRICPLSSLMEILSVPGCNAFSLQTGRHRDDLQADSCDILLPDLGARINDSSDLAGMINQLDLVICADSVAAHIAGGMDKPVWLLAPYVADWRWGYSGDSSPWYPNMRIFRQSAFGDWSSVIEEVRDALSERIQTRFGGGG